MPMMFTGLRLSLGIGWMVLIAAEMLAQNPGLGKFVWDEFQNGSSNSLGRIMVAVLVIGLIGFAARPRHADAAAHGELGQERGPALSGSTGDFIMNSYLNIDHVSIDFPTDKGPLTCAGQASTSRSSTRASSSR